MGDAPAVAAKPPCCVCAAPGGKHCTKCKSRHYCSKKCQLVDWHERGHKARCRQMAAEFQDRMLDELMPAKLKIKEEPAIFADVSSAVKAAPRAPVVRTAPAEVEPSAPNNEFPNWRDTCAICLDLLPVEAAMQIFYDCCCKKMCSECSGKCQEYDNRCPLCRTTPSKSAADWLRRMQKHVAAGHAEAQRQLGDAYFTGAQGLKKSVKRAFQLYQLSASQGHAPGQDALGSCHRRGHGCKLDFKAAAMWFRRAAEQGYHVAQFNLGVLFNNGQGVAQSYDEAFKWFGLAAAQGVPEALYHLGQFYANGLGAPQEYGEALRLLKRASALGCAAAAPAVDALATRLAAST